MAINVNLFFLFSVGCVFYLITSADARRLEPSFDNDSDADLSLSKTARLLGEQLSEQNIPRDQVTCAIARTRTNKHPLVLSTPHVQNFKGSEEAHIKVQHKTGTLHFKIYLFDEGDILLLGEAGFKNFCHIGAIESGGVGRWIFKPRE